MGRKTRFQSLVDDEAERRRFNEEKPEKKFDDRFDNKYYLYYEPPIAGSNIRTGQYHYYKNSKGNFIFFTVGSVIIIILFLIVGFFFFQENFASYFGSNKIDAEIVETDYYTDNISLIENEKILLRGMEFFYNKTGVQPVLLTVPYDEKYEEGDERTTFLISKYGEMFSDNAHLLIVYFEGENDSKENLTGRFRFTTGWEAKEVVDEYAQWNLTECLEEMNNGKKAFEVIVAQSLEETAKSIIENK